MRQESGPYVGTTLGVGVEYHTLVDDARCSMFMLMLDGRSRKKEYIVGGEDSKIKTPLQLLQSDNPPIVHPGRYDTLGS